MTHLLLWLWLAQGADVATTTLALHRGCVERTYWSARPAVITGGKISGSLMITWRAPKWGGGGRAFVAGLATGATVAAAWNTHVMQAGCR